MVPVVLLTGFLGSGKTTLLNQLLAEREAAEASGRLAGGKIALIVNEFGDVGIDGDLLPTDMTRQVELPGGCICCQLDEDLEKSLLELLEGQPDLETIFIETTGIAEPLPISWTLGRKPLADQVRLAVVVTVVDALEHLGHRSESPSVDAQVDYADILVLSKHELVAAAQLDPLLAHLRERNPYAPILRPEPSERAAELLDALADPEPREREAPPPNESARHRHHDLEAVSIPIDDCLDFEELTEALEGLGPNYLRIKGIAEVVDGSTGSTAPRMIAFHRVGARVSAEDAPRGARPRLVAIGSELDAVQLADCVRVAVLNS